MRKTTRTDRSLVVSSCPSRRVRRPVIVEAQVTALKQLEHVLKDLAADHVYPTDECKPCQAKKKVNTENCGRWLKALQILMYRKES